MLWPDLFKAPQNVKIAGMSRANRILLFGPVGLLVLIMVLYSVTWRISANTLSTWLDRANGGELAPGISFAFAEKTVGGFPLRLDAVLGGVTLAARTPRGEAAWRSENLAVHVAAFGAELVVFEADGLQSIAWPSGDGGSPSVLHVTAEFARATAMLIDGRLERFELGLGAMEAVDATMGAAPGHAFTVTRAQLQLVARPDDSIAIAANIEDADIGSFYRPPLGPDLARLQIEGTLTHSLALGAVRPSAASTREAGRAWREAGGVFAIHSITAQWGGAELTGAGELTLDEQNRLRGEISGRPQEPAAFLKAIGQSELLNADTRTQIDAFAQLIDTLPGRFAFPIRFRVGFPLGNGPLVPRARIVALSPGDGASYPTSGIEIDLQSAQVP